MCSAAQTHTVHTDIWSHMYTYTPSHEPLNTQPEVHPSDIVLCGHMTVRARGLLFSSCSSSSSSSSPRGSHCYARGSERFTFNFHFSCFGSRFTSRPGVFFSFLLLQLSWNHNVMYSAWGVALFTMQFDTTKPCSPLFSQCIRMDYWQVCTTNTIVHTAVDRFFKKNICLIYT